MLKALVSAVMLCAASPALAQTLKLVGLSPAAIDLTRADLEALGLIELRDAREVSTGGSSQRVETVYAGIDLPRLLDARGFDTLDRYAVRTATVLVVAKDGYKASFSWGELFNSAAGRQVFLILKENGAPLPARAGHFSLRSFSDSRPGPRHVRDVVEIRILLQ